jgi:hypothetical protein
MGGGIVMVVIGAVLIVVGIKALRESKSTAMPLFFRGIHQVYTRRIGIGLMVVGIALAIGGIVILASA